MSFPPTRHTVKPWLRKDSFHLQPARVAGFPVRPAGVPSELSQPVAWCGADLPRAAAPDFGLHFQERALGTMRADNDVQSALSFTVRSWSHNGLHYFVIGDASAQDLDKLSELLKAAG